MSIEIHNVPHALAPCNRLSVPEIACYHRDVAGETKTVTYAIRNAGESLWTGVQLVISEAGTSETRTGPHTTPQGAAGALNGPEPDNP